MRFRSASGAYRSLFSSGKAAANNSTISLHFADVLRWFAEEGADAWYKHSAEELLPTGTTCSCGFSKWRKEHDILDVWFDAGSSSFAVLHHSRRWPADVYWKGRTNIGDGSTVPC